MQRRRHEKEAAASDRTPIDERSEGRLPAANLGEPESIAMYSSIAHLPSIATRAIIKNNPSSAIQLLPRGVA